MQNSPSEVENPLLPQSVTFSIDFAHSSFPNEHVREEHPTSERKEQYLNSIHLTLTLLTSWAQQHEFVTRVGALMWWDVDHAYKVGSSAAVIWPARSKPGVEPRHLSEDLGVSALRVEGIAWGWSHRAAITSRSWQWKDNGSVPSGSAWPDGLVLIEPSLFIIFLDVPTIQRFD